MKKNKNKIRYSLHYKVRQQGYRLAARSRTIFVPYTQTEFSKQVLRLRDEFKYNIQTEII